MQETGAHGGGGQAGGGAILKSAGLGGRNLHTIMEHGGGPTILRGYCRIGRQGPHMGGGGGPPTCGGDGGL
uniref:Uncharacterized protein n=1 Tax=Desulfomonile tiedjei TaxID=2358 RepID=A0A7C4AS83_9BACT